MAPSHPHLGDLGGGGSTTDIPFGDMLARVLACPFLRYPLTIDHLKEAPLGFARG